MLYIYTVYCTVYRLRNFGEKLRSDQIRATACHGHLIFERHPVYRVTMQVSVLDSSGIDQAHLDSASVTRIGRDGLMVSGAETIPGRNYFHQVWWCVPCSEEGHIEAPGKIYRALISSEK